MKAVMCVVSLGLIAGSAFGAPLFELLPGPTIDGSPGAVVGWGYSLLNDNPTDWLAIDTLDADAFIGASPAVLFDFPILAPMQSVVVPYFAGLSGLYEITWDSNVIIGASNSGVFTLGTSWYDNDPLSGGQFVSAGPDLAQSYLVSVSENSAPEPGTLMLAGVGCLILLCRGLLRR